jgi:inner membrane protein
MPSTIGHALAGATVAWTTDAVSPPTRSSGAGLVVACMAIAAAPDVDLAFGFHRTYTHSIGMTAVVAATAAIVAACTRAPVLRTAFACAAAHGSHLLLDWLAVDRFPPYGLQALWPFSSDFYISGWDIFRRTERRHMLSAEGIRINALAVAQELLILGPLALVAFRARVSRSRSLGPISDRDGRRPPSGARADTAGTSDRPALRAARSGSPDRYPDR